MPDSDTKSTPGEVSLKSMLFEVVQRPADEREAEVARLAAGDEEVRRELWSLVGAWDRATVVLQDATPAIGVALTPRDLIGERVGPFELVEKIGEGGFGLVYRARQHEPVDRDVAVKLLKPGMDSGGVLARFDIERRALALLSHEAIARIYDAGTSTDGRPYFAMELVEGEPITQYCDTRRIGLEARVDLFVRACDGVHHAHTKGIIHRDLKPSNILVCDTDRGPVPKVIDFGIAKALDEPLGEVSVLTLARQVVGTPLYMSPEQATPDSGVDTRSDVFSLGAVLYELLCGTTPIDSETLTRGGLGTLGEVLSRGDIERPSVRAGRGELAEAAAGRRGVSSLALRRALAGDLDWIAMRALATEPDRRYQSAAALAEDLRRARRSEPIEARPPTKAYLISRFARRHRAAVAVAGTVALSLIALVGVLAVSLSNVREQRDLAFEAQREEARARADADATLGYFLEVMMAPSGDRMGHSVTMLEGINASAATIDERTVGKPALGARLHTATANIYREVGRPRQALPHIERAVEIARGSDELDTEALVSMLNDRALVLDDLGDFPGFKEGLIEAVEIADVELEPSAEARLVAVANLAGLVWNREERFEDAIGALQPIAEFDGDLKDDTRFSAMLNLAYALSATGRDAEAVTWYERLLAATEKSAQSWASTRLGSLNNLASIRYRSKDYEGALGVFERVLVETEQQFGEMSPHVFVVLNNIASAQQKLERHEDALATRDDAKRRADATLPPGHPIRAQLLSGRAGLLVDMGRLDEAERAMLDAHTIFESAGAPPDVVLHNAGLLADLYEMMGREDDAELWRVRAQPVPAEAIPPSPRMGGGRLGTE